MVHVCNHLTSGDDNPSRTYGKKNQLMTGSMVYVTGSMVYATNLTPRSDNPTHGANLATPGTLGPRARGPVQDALNPEPRGDQRGGAQAGDGEGGGEGLGRGGRRGGGHGDDGG
jgi:hypothetical protein